MLDSALNEQGGGGGVYPVTAGLRLGHKIAYPEILYTTKVNSILSGIYDLDQPNKIQKGRLLALLLRTLTY